MLASFPLSGHIKADEYKADGNALAALICERAFFKNGGWRET